MKHGLFAKIAAALLAIVSLPATRAQAQSLQLFVSGRGSDSNPCTLAQPCRTFQGALLNKVFLAAEVEALDPAFYGTLTLNVGRISIQGHGFAAISVTKGGTGITIRGADPVSLNGLIIDGDGVGSNGIRSDISGSLVVENCVIRNVTGSGLFFFPIVPAGGLLTVSNSYFTGSSFFGIFIGTGGSAPVTAAIERVGIYANRGVAGLIVDGRNGTGPLNVAVTDSAAANNSGAGFLVQSDVGKSVSSLVLTRSTAAGNDFGVKVLGSTASLRLAQSTVTGNVVGYSGLIYTFGDNYIVDNITNVGALSDLSKQ